LIKVHFRVSSRKTGENKSCRIQSQISLNYFANGSTLLVAQLVEALRYNPEGRGIDSRWYHWNFLLT
jgi:hypothetical protein